MINIPKLLLDKYGIVAQINKLDEEYNELKFELNTNKDRQNIIDEISDVIIVLKSICEYYKITEMEQEDSVWKKLQKAERKYLLSEKK